MVTLRIFLRRVSLSSRVLTETGLGFSQLRRGIRPAAGRAFVCPGWLFRLLLLFDRFAAQMSAGLITARQIASLDCDSGTCCSIHDRPPIFTERTDVSLITGLEVG
jgi:hypothetical protein